jgi:hypothetical protein
VSDASIAITSICPTGSSRRARGARDSGTNRALSTIAISPTGRLTRKIARHPTESTSAPPTTGPKAKLIPTTPPHIPIARARSRGSSNTLRMIDIATGLSIDPPTAWRIRKITSSSRFGASAHSSDPSEKMPRPNWNTRRRPIRSAVDPASISRLASTSV